MVLITLPFPKYNLNSQCIIALIIFWFFYNSFPEKLNNLKKNIKSFSLVSSLFFITIIGLIYTSNLDHAITNIKSLKRIINNDIRKLLNLFSIATILASLLGLGKALWFYYNGLGEYFYYLSFAKILDKHTTYFSLFVCVSLINIAYDLSLKKALNNFIRLIAIVYLVFILYLLSSKISIIYLIIVLLLLTVKSFFKIEAKWDKMKRIRLLILLILPLIFLTPSFKDRITREKASNLSERLLLWNAVVDNYLGKNLLFGAGTGDGHIGLVESYKEIEYEVAVKEEYNAHNQYLEQLLFYGILGLFLLIALMYFTLHTLATNEQTLFFIIYLSFLIYMFSESILERHSGLILFSFLTSIFLSTSIRKSINEEN